MEMQADPNVAEASQSPQPLSPQLEPLLSEIVGSATLTEQCNRCSRNLDACIRSIGTVARTLASTLDKTKLVSIEARLEEHRIRFEIWKSDCNVSNGSLSTIHNEQEASLYGLVDALFNNFNEACRSLHESIARILLNRSLQAEQRPLEETCDKLTQLIHRLAELQPSVQMAQAIHQGKGPYSNLYRGVSDIREKYKDQSSEFAPEEGSEFANDDLSSRTSGDEQCRKCKRWMPFHALAFHEDSCQGTVEVPDEASASASVSGSEAVASVDMDADILIEESPSKGDKRRRQSKSSIAFHAQMSRAPQGYAFAVKQHSRRKLQNSLYPGSNYSAFANHLHRGITDRGKNQRRPSLLKSKATMTCYTYSEKNPPEKRNFFAHSGLTELSLFLQSRGENCVIILGGNVSPSILNTLGTSCSIDPEFFRRHLNLEKSDFSTPTLPSVPTNMFKLRYTTIGVRSQPTLPPYELDQNSDDLSTDLHRQFRWQREMGCHGESIIRRLHIYDDEYVSIEQDISLYSKTSDTSRVGWFGCVWIDSGAELDLEDAKSVRFLPTIQLKENVAVTTDPTKSLPDGEITQSAQLLQENFGCELDDVVIEQDPFYAFHQLFMFTAFSEIQFLNLMEAQLRKILKNLDNPAFERLNHHRIILSDHCWQLQETLAVIRRRGPPSKWPIAESSVIKLEINFHHLYSRATHLINEYTYAIAQYSYKPAQPQTQQAPQIQRPVVNTTVLCFIIIPLAISCFFSMNFKELQALSIWIYFVIAVPSSLITFGCLWFGGWILSKERRQNILRLFRPLNLVPEDLEKQRP